jgi:SulP family sulfate permease
MGQLQPVRATLAAGVVLLTIVLVAAPCSASAAGGNGGVAVCRCVGTDRPVRDAQDHRASRGETWVLAVTFLATLAPVSISRSCRLLASLLVYLSRTTRPRLTDVAPDPDSSLRRFVPVDDIGAALLRECPQLIMLRVDGSLFFGAVEHVRDAIDAARSHSPNRRHMLLVGSGINFIDVAGAELLVQEASTRATWGRAVSVQSETGCPESRNGLPRCHRPRMRVRQ